MRYIKIYPNSGAVQTALVEKELGKPYMAYLEDEHRIDWNSLGGEPEIDPMFWEPLTIEIENTDPAQFYFVFQSVSGVGQATSIYANKNGSPFQRIGYVYVSDYGQYQGTIDNAASEGDVYKFFGASSGVGGYGFGTGTTDGSFHFFGSIGTLKGKVYGNIKSLLTNKDTWDALVANKDKAGIDNIPMNDRAFMNLFQNKNLTFNEDATYHLVLPDTNLSTNCFKGLFNNCIKIVTAPVLQASALTSGCYVNMFSSCFRLNHVTCLADTTTSQNSFTNWLSNVAATGTFEKRPGSTWSTGASGIPNGWTVVDADI